MTVKKKVLFVVPVVLLLVLCVAPCMAYTITNPSNGATYDAGNADSVTVSFTGSGYFVRGYYIGNTFYDIGGRLPYETSISLDSNSNTMSIQFVIGTQQTTEYITFTVTYTYQEPTPEPTPVPSPYISVTELYSDNLGTVYRLQCLPDVNTIFYSAIVPYLIPSYQAGQYAEELSSADTVVEYRVPAGGTSVFSSVYQTYPMTLGVISTTITAPPLTPAQNNTFNPIPDQSQKPLTPFTSGTWQPAISSGQIDVISKSPYIALLSNISDSVQLPVMESPQSVRDRLVPPELENITGPLYDLVDGWADFTNWIPRTIADTVVTLYTPFTTAIADCKTVLLSMTAQLAELMKPMYILTPVMYLFIPDFVWIGVCMVLVLLILHALAVFIFGYDVTYYYMGRDTIVADAVPEFPALEK